MTTGILGATLSAARGKAARVDSDLDDIFKHSAGASVVKPVILPAPAAETDLVNHNKKRSLAGDSTSESSSKKRKSAPSSKAKQPQPSKAISVAEEDDASLEDKYHASTHKTSPQEQVDDEDASEDDEPLQHETVAASSSSKAKAKGKKKTRIVREDESKEDRDRRTIFVGNLPVEVMKSKSATKSLNRHFTTRIPGSKVESVRFRSIPFQSPTSNTEKEGKSEASPTKRQQRESERAAQWKSEKELEEQQKKFLTPAEKKRIAFIKKEIHAEAGSINAYIVFAYPDPEDNSASLDPFEAADLAVAECDGTTFMERIIRVDRASRSSSQPSLKGDPKLAIFVGNLDFEAQEQALREFFDELISKEFEDLEPDAAKVKHVRIVRDSATQLGKGFAYVHFHDRHVVDGILALEESKLKFAKRTLRVQKCKTLPGGKTAAHNASTSSGPKSDGKHTRGSKPVVKQPGSVALPKGDPTLGERLRDLSKEERKVAKSGDPDRVARRLAKKKKRNAVNLDERRATVPKKKKATSTAPSSQAAKSRKTRSSSSTTKPRGKRPGGSSGKS